MAGRFDARAVARLERMYAAPAIAEQRARTRAALALRPGERGLDVGCGPGFLAVELAREVGPAGCVVAADTSAEMVAAARERARREGVERRIAVACADAAALPLRDGSLDFVAAVQVYLYVPDVAAALAETARVLRRGGRLAVMDTDWDSCVWLTADRGRHRRVLDAWRADFAQPHLPPRLPGLLRRAGLMPAEVAAIPVLELRYDAGSYSGGIIAAVRAAAIRHGVPAEEAEAWAADLRGRTAEGDYFFSLTRYLVVAGKP